MKWSDIAEILQHENCRVCGLGGANDLHHGLYQRDSRKQFKNHVDEIINACPGNMVIFGKENLHLKENCVIIKQLFLIMDNYHIGLKRFV